MNDYNVLDICGYAINLSPILAGPGFAVRTVAQVQWSKRTIVQINCIKDWTQENIRHLLVTELVTNMINFLLNYRRFIRRAWTSRHWSTSLFSDQGSTTWARVFMQLVRKIVSVYTREAWKRTSWTAAYFKWAALHPRCVPTTTIVNENAYLIGDFCIHEEQDQIPVHEMLQKLSHRLRMLEYSTKRQLRN